MLQNERLLSVVRTTANPETYQSGLPMSAAGSYSAKLIREWISGSEMHADGGRDVVRVSPSHDVRRGAQEAAL